METIADETFMDQFIEIDNKSFVRCTFVNCTLNYHGSNVSFDRSVMRGCKHMFFGCARQTLHYLQGVGLVDSDPMDWGELPAEMH